jgi:hypothetical protein
LDSAGSTLSYASGASPLEVHSERQALHEIAEYKVDEISSKGAVDEVEYPIRKMLFRSGNRWEYGTIKTRGNRAAILDVIGFILEDLQLKRTHQEIY